MLICRFRPAKARGVYLRADEPELAVVVKANERTSPQLEHPEVWPGHLVDYPIG